MGGSSAISAGGLPPLPPGATLNTPPPSSGALPPLPPGATLNAGAAAEKPTGMSGYNWLPGTGGEEDPLARFSSGFYKSVKSGLGGILDMISRPPAVKTAFDPQAATEVSPAQQHVQDAAQWLRSGSEPDGFWEHVGALGEQALELIGTEGLLKMAGPARGAGQVAETTEKLKQAQQVAQALKLNPKLAGLVAVGIKASKDATLLGSQTLVHTEDPTQAAIAGVTGGAISGGIGAAGELIKNIAPRTVRIAGEEIPVLKSQLNEQGLPTDTGAERAPAIARAQQRGAQAVVRNTAQRATAAALARINEGRPEFGATQEPERLLAAGEGAQPFKFTLEGPGTETAREGALTHPAEEIPRTHTGLPAERGPEDVTQERIGTEPEYLSPAGAGEDWAQRQGRSWVERRIPGYLNPGADVEGAEDVARGGGNLETTNPLEAESWLRQLEDLQQTPEHGKLSSADQAAIETQRKSLSDQLGVYYNSPYAQRFAPVDVPGATSTVRTFGDAAAQIEAAAKPVYAVMDRVSGGDFNRWKGAARRAEEMMRRPISEEAYQNAQSNLREANAKINDIIDSNRGAVSNQDYFTAKAAWRDSARLNELHAVFEGMANGVTTEESDTGLTRVVTGKAKQLENYLADGNNREQLEQLIGKDGVANLKQMTLLLSKASTARQTASVLGHVAHQLHYAARSGAILGGVGGEMLGGHWAQGAAVGAGTGAAIAGIRMVLEHAATSPRIGQMVEYAAKNGINPQIYAPLIARTILEPFQRQEEPEQ